jgi:hypothetical protein
MLSINSTSLRNQIRSINSTLQRNQLPLQPLRKQSEFNISNQFRQRSRSPNLRLKL